MVRTILTRIFGSLILAAATTGASAEPPDLSRGASQLLPLERGATSVTIPLDGQPGWRGIREGIDAQTGAGGLAVRYRIAPGQPSGAAIVFARGSLRGVRALRVRAIGDRSMQLIPTLQSASGAAFAFPALSISKGRVVEAELQVSELGFFAPQSKVDEPESFTPADAVMLTLLDISGFTGGSGDASFTIESIEGVL